jgi:ATP-dependent Lhr-like helicase
MRALAELMLERHGIVTRETAIAEGIPGGFASIYGELQNLELLGTARRGYFVEGLGGAQFALPGAVERLRSLPQSDGTLQVLAATDPANPYGATLSWPKLEGQRRPARTAGAYVMLRDGEPLIYVERGGKGISVLVDHDDERIRPAFEALAAFVTGGRGRRLSLERIDGEPVVGSPWEALLVELGFRAGPRKLTLSA